MQSLIVFLVFLVCTGCSHQEKALIRRDTASEFNCSDAMDAFLTEDRNALIPNKFREDGMVKDYRKILIDWKADSAVARRESEALAIKEMQEMGMSGHSFIVEVDDLPKSTMFSEVALKNSKIKYYIEQLNNAGYKLVIDPHMAIQDDFKITRGVFSPSRNSIRILPYTTWEVFLHEYQHFMFFKMGLRNQSYTLATSKLSKPEEDAILQVAKKLYSKGYSETTVDESLAVDQEIKTLYSMGYTPWSIPVYEARKYAWDFQLKDIRAGISSSQDAKLIKAKTLLLNPYFVRSLFLGSGAAMSFYHEKENALIVVDPKNAHVDRVTVHPQDKTER